MGVEFGRLEHGHGLDALDYVNAGWFLARSPSTRWSRWQSAKNEKFILHMLLLKNERLCLQ